MEEGFVPDDFELIGNLAKRVCYANAKNYLGLEVS
jgi:glucuronate isomerase